MFKFMCLERREASGKSSAIVCSIAKCNTCEMNNYKTDIDFRTTSFIIYYNLRDIKCILKNCREP